MSNCRRCTKWVAGGVTFCKECRNPFAKRLKFVFALSGKTEEDMYRKTELNLEEIKEMFQFKPDYYPSSTQLIELKRFFNIISVDYFFEPIEEIAIMFLGFSDFGSAISLKMKGLKQPDPAPLQVWYNEFGAASVITNVDGDAVSSITQSGELRTGESAARADQFSRFIYAPKWEEDIGLLVPQ